MSVTLTAREARYVRDLLFHRLASIEEDKNTPWFAPAGQTYGAHLRICMEAEHAPAYEKMYYALRSALRLPKKEMNFTVAYDTGWSLKRKVALFEAWLGELHDAFGFGQNYGPALSEQKDMLRRIELSTRVLGCQEGAVLTQAGWRWAGKELGSWADLTKHLVAHYTASADNMMFWEMAKSGNINPNLYSLYATQEGENSVEDDKQNENNDSDEKGQKR